MSSVVSIFGQEFSNIETRKKSYDLLRNFLAENHDWMTTAAPDSDQLVSQLRAVFRPLTHQQFAFLLTHTGYIPEDYNHDSSEEVIYTKLVEAMVQEWAIRLGFKDTELPRQKSSKEDVTIKDEKHLIVADAKTYRLGRSQGAPNVKDALKEGDISKWLSWHNEDKLIQLGGLITFPSQHDWKGGSDFYFYLTKKELPIVCLFYEHMAYLLLSEDSKNRLISMYKSYADLFPSPLTKKENNKANYWLKILQALFSDITQWNDFNKIAQKIIEEKVFHTLSEVNAHLLNIRTEVASTIPEDATNKQLRDWLLEARTEIESSVIKRQLQCITKFRTVGDRYLTADEAISTH